MCHLSHWSGQQQHLLPQLQVLGAQEMQWAQALDKGPWIHLYMVPGNCTPLGLQTTERSPSRTWQAGSGSFLLLSTRCSQQVVAVNFQPQHVWKPPGRSSRSWYQFSLPTTSLARHVVTCTALVCRAQCSMPVRLGHWQSQTPMSAAKWHGNDQKDLQCQAARHCHHQIKWATCTARHWGSGPHSEGEKASLVWTCGTLQWCSQDSFWPTGWWKAWAWEAKADMEAADREGLQRVEGLAYRPSW